MKDKLKFYRNPRRFRTQGLSIPQHAKTQQNFFHRHQDNAFPSPLF